MTQEAATSPSTDTGVWSRLSLHEFLVDFFGGLVPGVLFTVVFAASLFPAIDALSAALHNGYREPSPWVLADNFIKATSQTPSMIWIALFVFVLMFGYVIGHLFLRLDPKVPDLRSFARLKREALKEGKPPNDDGLRRRFACASPNECQFPYEYMNLYLRDRGHEHLARIADRWCGPTRSKTYINRLKLRLAFRNPGKYRPVVRNEAHVRLVTSTWYMAQSLWKVTFYVSAPLLLAAGVVWGMKNGARATLPWIFNATVPTLLAFSGGLFAMRKCEAFLHYQRLREVYVVLELAYTAHHDSAIIDEDKSVTEDRPRTSGIQEQAEAVRLAGLAGETLDLGGGARN